MTDSPMDLRKILVKHGFKKDAGISVRTLCLPTAHQAVVLYNDGISVLRLL